jgi:hypothetical protein
VLEGGNTELSPTRSVWRRGSGLASRHTRDYLALSPYYGTQIQKTSSPDRGRRRTLLAAPSDKDPFFPRGISAICHGNS